MDSSLHRIFFPGWDKLMHLQWRWMKELRGRVTTHDGSTCIASRDKAESPMRSLPCKLLVHRSEYYAAVFMINACFLSMKTSHAIWFAFIALQRVSTALLLAD